MAYVPPHKRQSLGNARPAPASPLMMPRFRRGMAMRPSPVSNDNKGGKIVYADSAINNWYAVEVDSDGHLPSHVNLEPSTVELKSGWKPLILVNKKCSEDNTTCTPSATTVAKKVLQDLQSSLELLKNETDNKGLEQMKPTLVARFGNILFHQTSSSGTVVNGPLEEAELRQMRRIFYTNIPSSYMQTALEKVVSNIGLDFCAEKEIYHVKLSDKTRPDSNISCKCNVTNGRNLVLYKVETNHLRLMVNDISVLDKDLDLRIMLSKKRILRGLSESEFNSMRDLINSAVLDSNVKGGLRWPLGTSSGDRFAVVGAWHITAKHFKNKSFCLTLRHADRFDFKTETGEVTTEVNFKLKKLLAQLQEQDVTKDSFSELVKDNMKLIWDNFLCCEKFLK